MTAVLAAAVLTLALAQQPPCWEREFDAFDFIDGAWSMDADLSDGRVFSGAFVASDDAGECGKVLRWTLEGRAEGAALLMRDPDTGLWSLTAMTAGGARFDTIGEAPRGASTVLEGSMHVRAAPPRRARITLADEGGGEALIHFEAEPGHQSGWRTMYRFTLTRAGSQP